MVKNMSKFLDADIILWAHPTNPLTNHLHYNDALKNSDFMRKKGWDSLYAVLS